jgi:hypothetical protein
VVGGGEFPCPCCKFQRPYSEIESKRWFALYFIPIFPVSYQGRHVQCHACGQSFGQEVIQGASPFTMAQGSLPMASVAELPLMAQVGAPPLVQSGPQVGPPPGTQLKGATTHFAYQPPPTSGLGIVSMVLGIMSPFFFLACGASLFTAIGAVICGHLSLLKKADAHGRTPGRGAAIAGLVLGYISLLLSPIAIYFSYTAYRGFQDAKMRMAKDLLDSARSPDGSQILRDMESKVVGASGGIAHGNTEEAKQLAQEFSDALMQVRDENFVGGNPKSLKLTKGKFVVCCELKQESCAFIVHVPEFRNFEDDAKEGLADLAWAAAQETAIKRIGPKGTLAVGLRGVLLYGAVIAGNCEGAPRHRDVAESADKDYLIAFLQVTEEAENEAIVSGTNPVADAPSEASNAAATTTNPPVASTAAPATDPPTTSPATRAQPVTPPVAYTPLPGAIGSPPATSAPPPSSPGGSDASSGAPTARSGENRNREGRNSLRRQRSPEFVPSGLPAPKVEILKPIEVTQPGLTSKGMTFSPDGKYFAAQVSDQISIFDVKKGKMIASESWVTGQLFGAGALLFTEQNPDQLVVGGGSGAVQLWKFTAKGSVKMAAALTKQPSGITTLRARSDATFILGGAADGNLFWQQIKSNKPGEIRQVKGLRITVKDIFLPETGLEFWATDGLELVQVDMKTATVISTSKLDGTYSFGVWFSPDGKYLATTFGSELIVMDGKTGEMLFRYRAPESLSGASAWLPGQERVLVAMRGGPAIFDVKKGYVSQITIGDGRSLIDGICA